MKRLLSSFIAVFLFAAIIVPGVSNAADSPSFSDVSGTFWAKDAIDNLVQSGVVKGYEDNTFRPDASVTREEFATLISQTFYLDLPPTDSPQTFVDVSPSRWSFPMVEASKEFLTGFYPPNGKAVFNPTVKATREDVAVALVKAMHYVPDDLQDPNILNRFYDTDEVSPNVREYMSLAVEKKLMAGYNDGTVKPQNPVTRAEAASLLYRILKSASGDSQSALTLNVDVPATTSTPTFYVTGDVTKGAKVYINNKEVEVVQGQFKVAYRADKEGTYTFTVSARIPGGKTQEVTKTVKYEQGAPTLEVTGAPDTSDKQRITVSWNVKDDNDNSPVVYVNDQKQSSWTSSIAVDLVQGDNTIKVRAENSSGKSVEVVKHVLFQSGGPVLTVQDVPATTDKENVTINWTVQDKNDPNPVVSVNDQVMSYYQNSTSIKLNEGTNTITIKAVNNLGKSTQVTKTIVLSGGAPTLIVDPLPDTVGKNSVTVSWNVSDANDGNPKVYVNDALQSYYSSSATVSLNQGPNTITVRAVNKLGKTTEVSKTVNFVSDGPVLQVGSIPTTTSKKSFTVSWNVSDKNDGNPKVFINGEEQSYYSNSRTINLTAGANTIKIKATNKLGQFVEQSYNISFEPSAPILTLGYAPETTQSSTFTLNWNVSDENDGAPKVYVNDKLMSSYYSSANVTLNLGVNTFKIVASNQYGKTTVVNYTVTYSTTPPTTTPPTTTPPTTTPPTTPPTTP